MSHSQLAVPAYKVRYQASNVFSAECAQLQSERHELGQRLAALLATTAQTETELVTQRQELQRAGKTGYREQTHFPLLGNTIPQ